MNNSTVLYLLFWYKIRVIQKNRSISEKHYSLFRIACSLDKFEQRALEYNHTLCILQPGCYFDAELAEIRTGYPTTLSGTPVCHFAIRSPIFHKYAEKVRLAVSVQSPMESSFRVIEQIIFFSLAGGIRIIPTVCLKSMMMK